MKLKDTWLLGRNVMINLDSILKSRDITLPTNVRLVKATVFPVVMYGWESWTIKKAEHRGIDAFELWCWRRLLRVPWTSRRSNQPILKEISPEYSLEGLMLKLNSYTLATWYEELTLEKTLMLGKIEGRREGDHRGWDGLIASLTPWTWVWANSGSWCWTEKPGGLQSMGLQESDTTERLNRTEHQRIDAFELYCWRRPLRVPWTARRSNQSILKEISPEYSLEGLMLKLNSYTLATWCKELTHWKRPWCWERLKAGGEEVNRGWDGWMASLTRWTTVWATSRSWWWTGKPGMLQSTGSQRVGHNWATELSNSFSFG